MHHFCAGNDLSPQTTFVKVVLLLLKTWPRRLSLNTNFHNLPGFYLTARSFHFPIRPSDGSQLHKPMKEEHLATRPIFVFVTVSQLNLDHSVLALCVSALDGSVPYVPMNATWICVQKGVCFLFLKNSFSVVLCLRRR